MIIFADLIEAEAKELILDIKYPATKKQVNIWKPVYFIIKKKK